MARSSVFLARGRRSDPDADRSATSRVAGRVRETGQPAVRVWRPPEHLAFGPRDANADGYAEARRIAESRGYPPIERDTGGRAVAFTGSTVAFATVHPIDDSRRGIQDRYDTTSRTVRTALETLGVDATTGEPEHSFCPGTHSLQACGKVVGIAQRVQRAVAIVGGITVVERDAFTALLGPIYDALGLAFDPDAVGSVARAGGTDDPETVRVAIEDALVGNRSTSPLAVTEL